MFTASVIRSNTVSAAAQSQQGEVMAVGPVDVYIIGFPGNKFTGRIAPAILELVENGTIRVLDLLFVMKDADGAVTTLRGRGHRRGGRGLPLDRHRAAGCVGARGCRGGQRRSPGQQRGPPDRVREPVGGKGGRRPAGCGCRLDRLDPDPGRRRGRASKQASPVHLRDRKERHGTSTHGSSHRRRRGNRHGRLRARGASSGRQVRRAGRAAVRAAAAAAPPPAAPAEDDATAQLQNLANLHAQGVLTDEEFAAGKAKILGI